MMKKRWYTLSLVTAAALAAVALFYILARNGIGFSCLFYELTGLQCPGCGNSRAMIALLQLDPLEAIQYNLLFPLEFSYLLWVLVRSCCTYFKTGHFSYKPKYLWLDIAILVIVILWGILRNLI